MFARLFELALALWLAASPWVLGALDEPSLARASWIGAVLVALLSGAALIRRQGRLHLLLLAVGAALTVWGWAAFPRPGPAGAQNLIVVGLLLGLLAVVPTGALRPPQGWRRYTDGEEPPGEANP